MYICVVPPIQRQNRILSKRCQPLALRQMLMALYIPQDFQIAYA